MNELVLFASSFVTVALLVVQSISNQHGRVVFAFFNSFLIGIAQIALYKIVPDATWTELLAFVCGGPFGNLAAHWVRRHDVAIIKRLHRR